MEDIVGTTVGATINRVKNKLLLAVDFLIRTLLYYTFFNKNFSKGFLYSKTKY